MFMTECFISSINVAFIVMQTQLIALATSFHKLLSNGTKLGELGSQRSLEMNAVHHF
jgi:hypothetical protein